MFGSVKISEWLIDLVLAGRETEGYHTAAPAPGQDRLGQDQAGEGHQNTQDF